MCLYNVGDGDTPTKYVEEIEKWPRASKGGRELRRTVGVLMAESQGRGLHSRPPKWDETEGAATLRESAASESRGETLNSPERASATTFTRSQAGRIQVTHFVGV